MTSSFWIREYSSSETLGVNCETPILYIRYLIENFILKVIERKKNLYFSVIQPNQSTFLQTKDMWTFTFL